MNTYHYKFVQVHRIYTIKRGPNVKYGFWPMMIYQFRFISYNTCTTLVEMLIMREAVYVWRQGMIGILCTFLLILL